MGGGRVCGEWRGVSTNDGFLTSPPLLAHCGGGDGGPMRDLEMVM